MAEIFEKLDSKKAKDIRVLSDFISIFCREKHRTEPKEPFYLKDEKVESVLKGRNLTLCRDCSKLLSHGIAKLLLCPYDPKPMCKKCETHCYAAGYRERVREIMRFSGRYLIRHGRLDLLLHYLF